MYKNLSRNGAYVGLNYTVYFVSFNNGLFLANFDSIHIDREEQTELDEYSLGPQKSDIRLI